MKANLKIEAIGYNSNNLNRLLPRSMRIPSRYWVAEITGVHSVYKLDRTFLRGKIDYREANSKASRGVHVNYILEAGKIYEVSKPQSWRSTVRFFATVSESGEIREHGSYEDAKAEIANERS